MELLVFFFMFVSLLGICLASTSTWRYKRELKSAGKATSMLGSIGSCYLEGKAFWLVSLTITFPSALGLTLFSYLLIQIYGWQLAVAIVPYIVVLGCSFLVLIVGWFGLTTEGRGRRRALKILRGYWRNPLTKSNLRRSLEELLVGNEADRRALEYISRRGCSASLVAVSVLEEEKTTMSSTIE